MVDHRGKKTSWGRVVGTAILALVFFSWAALCWRRKEWVEIDGSMVFLISIIYAFNSIKSIVETTAIANPDAETQNPP